MMYYTIRQITSKPASNAISPIEEGPAVEIAELSHIPKCSNILDNHVSMQRINTMQIITSAFVNNDIIFF